MEKDLLKDRVFEEVFGSLESSYQFRNNYYVKGAGSGTNKILILLDRKQKGSPPGCPITDKFREEIEDKFAKSGINAEMIEYSVFFKIDTEEHTILNSKNVRAMSRIIATELDLLKPELLICAGPVSYTIISRGYNFDVAFRVVGSPNQMLFVDEHGYCNSSKNMLNLVTVTPSNYTCHMLIVDLKQVMRQKNSAKDMFAESFGIMQLPKAKTYIMPTLENLEKQKIDSNLDSKYSKFEVLSSNGADKLVTRFGSRLVAKETVLADGKDCMAGKIIFALIDATYNDKKNDYIIYGRTKRGCSIAAIAANPTFHFYLKSKTGSHCKLKDRFQRLVDGSKADADYIAELVKIKLMNQKSNQSIDSKLKAVAFNVELSPVEKRSYYKFRNKNDIFIKITYKYAPMGRKIANIMRELMGGLHYFEKNNTPSPTEISSMKYIKAFELDVSPVERLLYNGSLSIGEWCICVNPALICMGGGTGDYSTDLSISTNCSSITSKGVDPNQEPCTIRALYFDTELPTYGPFPTHDKSPIVSICGVVQTHNYATTLEYSKNTKNLAGGDVIRTGRSDYDDLFVFSLGTCPELDTVGFEKSDSIPSAPQPPMPFIDNSLAENIVCLTKGQIVETEERNNILGAVYEWILHGRKVENWITYVGVIRALYVFYPDVDPTLTSSFNLVSNLISISKMISSHKIEEFEGSSINVSQWIHYVNTVASLYNQKKFKNFVAKEFNASKSAELLGSRNNWMRCGPFSDEGWVEAAGTIQAMSPKYMRKPRIFSFKTEKDMLTAFLIYIQQIDPDVVSGYNVKRFDIPMLINRAILLGISVPGFGKGIVTIGRNRNEDTLIENDRFYSKASGERIITNIISAGRTTLDLLEYMLKNEKFRDYNLQSVSTEIVGEGKDAVPYSAIHSLFINNRKRLNKYCLKDADLCLRIVNLKNVMNFSYGMSKLTGNINIGDLYSKGQQARIMGTVIRSMHFYKPHMIIPTHETKLESILDDANEIKNAYANNETQDKIENLLKLWSDNYCRKGWDREVNYAVDEGIDAALMDEFERMEKEEGHTEEEWQYQYIAGESTVPALNDGLNMQQEEEGVEEKEVGKHSTHGKGCISARAKWKSIGLTGDAIAPVSKKDDKKKKEGPKPYYDKNNADVGILLESVKSGQATKPARSCDTRKKGKKVLKEELEKPPDKSSYNNNDEYTDAYIKFLFDTSERLRAEKKSNFEGAIVIPPITRKISATPVLCLDFISLYPSIIQAFNTGHCTMGTRTRFLKIGYTDEQLDNEKFFYKSPAKSFFKKTNTLEHIYFIQVHIDTPQNFLSKGIPLKDLKNPILYTTEDTAWVGSEEAHKFPMHVNGSIRDGKVEVVTLVGDANTCSLLRMLEKMLTDLRKAARAEQATHPEGSQKYAILEGRQLSLKLSANSVYGLSSMRRGKLASNHIGPAITVTGKIIIIKAIEIVMRAYLWSTVWGGDTDSYFVETENVKTLKDVIDNYKEMLKILDVFKKPIKINFEKVMVPYLSAAKKRYAFLRWEPFYDQVSKGLKMPKDGKLSFKGIEATRRDNCMIVPYTQTEYLRILMANYRDLANCLQRAMEHVRKTVIDLIHGRINLSMLIESRQKTKVVYKTTKLPMITVDKFLSSIGEPVTELGSRCKYVIVKGESKLKPYQCAMPPQHALKLGKQIDYSYIINNRLKKPIMRLIPINLIPEGKAHEFMFGPAMHHHTDLSIDTARGLGKYFHTTQLCPTCGNRTVDPICKKCYDSNKLPEAKRMFVKDIEDIDKELKKCEAACRKCMSIESTEQIECDNDGCQDMFPRLNAYKNYDVAKKKLEILEEHSTAKSIKRAHNDTTPQKSVKTKKPKIK